jgi:hypothetical protein
MRRWIARRGVVGGVAIVGLAVGRSGAMPRASAGDMRDDRASEIDECPHNEFDEPTGQCRQCGAHYTTIIERYRNKVIAANLAADAAAAYIADAARELAELKAFVARLTTPP